MIFVRAMGETETGGERERDTLSFGEVGCVLGVISVWNVGETVGVYYCNGRESVCVCVCWGGVSWMVIFLVWKARDTVKTY